MWHLEKPSSKDLDNYVGIVFPLVKKKILGRRKKGHFLVWCDYLLPSGDDDNMIRNVLVAEPEELVKLNKKYQDEMILLRPAGRRRYTKKQLHNFLLSVFDYRGIVKEERAYNIACLKKVNTCPYCNRTYTFTIGQDKKGKTTSKVKPQFDHWFAHAQYPLLGLSFYNLIPSCSICNSSAKGTATFSLDKHIHPYTTNDCNPDFQFIPVLKYDKDANEIKWSVKLKRSEKTKEDNTIKALFLDELYAEHGPLEVKDIMDFAIKNNPTYLKTLFNKVCEELKEEYSQSDVYRMLFGIEAELDKTLERPLTKLKRDILKLEGIIV